MQFFFDPKSIAVVGASPRKTGANLLGNLTRSYPGTIYPVNPGYEELGGLPCYPSVAALPGPADLAIVLVPAPAVPAVIEQCAARGVKGVMIQSAGFAETGPAGAELQAKALAAARAGGVRLWGPTAWAWWT